MVVGGRHTGSVGFCMVLPGELVTQHERKDLKCHNSDSRWWWGELLTSWLAVMMSEWWHVTSYNLWPSFKAVHLSCVCPLFLLRWLERTINTQYTCITGVVRENKQYTLQHVLLGWLERKSNTQYTCITGVVGENNQYTIHMYYWGG